MAFTTKGEIPDEQIEFRESVTFEDEKIRMVRIDKFHHGEWVGNDLRGEIKTGHEFMVTQGQIG